MLLAVLTLQELPGFRGTVECSYCQGIFPTVPVQSLFSAPSPCADVHHLWSTHTCASTLRFWNPTNSLKSLWYNNFFSQSSIVPLSSHIFSSSRIITWNCLLSLSSAHPPFYPFHPSCWCWQSTLLELLPHLQGCSCSLIPSHSAKSQNTSCIVTRHARQGVKVH